MKDYVIALWRTICSIFKHKGNIAKAREESQRDLENIIKEYADLDTEIITQTVLNDFKCNGPIFQVVKNNLGIRK